jgi:hypothetical protein
VPFAFLLAAGVSFVPPSIAIFLTLALCLTERCDSD